MSEANRGKVLESVTLPPSSTPGSSVVRAYLMALTLEAGAGEYVMPNLGGPSGECLLLADPPPLAREQPEPNVVRIPGKRLAHLS